MDEDVRSVAGKDNRNMGVFVAYQSCRGLTSFVSLYARGTLTDGPSRPGEFVTFRSDVQYVPVPADRRETAAVHPSPTVRAEHTRFSNQLRFLRRHQHNNCNGDDNDNVCSYDTDCSKEKTVFITINAWIAFSSLLGCCQLRILVWPNK